MRRAIAAGLGLATTVLLAAAWLSSQPTGSQLSEVRELRTRLDRLGSEPRHRPPELVPPRAPGPGITG